MQTNHGWRDALGWILRMAWEVDTASIDAGEAVKKIAAVAEAALKDNPPRNCDVGTAEEQASRCLAYCKQHNCKDCPCNTIGRCTLIWAQMPYEKGDMK